MAIYAWVAAAKSIRSKIATLAAATPSTATPSTASTANAVDIEAATLVATLYATVRLTTSKSTSGSASAMVAASVAHSVASTIGLEDTYTSRLLDMCASSYRVAEQDLAGYDLPNPTNQASQSNVERYIASNIPASGDDRIDRALRMVFTMAARSNMPLEDYLNMLVIKRNQ